MTPEPMPIPADALLSHAGSIRALALSILGDEHAAEDVLQETWMRAIERPPPRHDSIGGWLRRVAEGIAISRLRSEGRRRRRETMWTEDRDCTHSAYDGEERAEVLRSVVDEVLALDEPYKETILRRYFEGMKPRDISAATSTSVATVNSRLQRAQAQLRERLDRRLSDRCGGMRGALLALVGAPEAAAGGAVTLWSASTALKIGVAVVALAGIAALATIATRDRPPEQDLARAAPAGEARAAIPLDPAREEQRTALAPTAATETASALAFPPPAPAPFAFEVAIEPLDGLGRPLPGCDVWIAADPGLPAHVGATGWDGALRLAWRGDEPRATLIVRASRAGRGSTALRRVTVESGGPRTVQLALEHGPAFEAAMRADAAQPGVPNVRPPRPASRFVLDAAGNGVFLDPWLVENDFANATGAQSADSDGLLKAAEAALAAAERARSPVLPAFGEAASVPRAAELELQVLDADGRPIPGAEVCVLSAGGAPRIETRADERGVAALAVPSGALAVFAGAPGRAHPLARARLEVAPGERRTLSLALPHQPLARVRLVAAAAAHARWVYELRDALGSTVARGEFDAEGRAAIPLAGGGPYALLAREGRVGPAVVVAAELYARETEQEIAAPPEPRTRTLLVAVEGERAGEAVVRVERVDSGDALEAPPGDAGSFNARGLPAGDYRVTVGAPARGWIDAGVVHLERGRGPERVFVRLDLPGELELPSGGQALARIEVSRSGMRLVSPQLRARGGDVLRVTPGTGEILIAIDRRVERKLWSLSAAR